MKSRILSIALALSLLAAIFVALPAKSAIDYTGSVRTTDDNGVAKIAFTQGEGVFVYVTMNYHGDPMNASMAVRLQSTTFGTTYSTLNVAPGDYTGWGLYNSSEVGDSLGSGVGLGALDEGVYNVAVYAGGERVAQTYITIKAPGIRLDPAMNVFTGDHKTVTAYAPLQNLTVTVLLSEVQSTNEFYVQIVNATDVTLSGFNWTGQFSASGWWIKNFQLPADIADGQYRLRVRQASNDQPWYTVPFYVQKYVFEVIPHRGNYIPGMTALIDWYAINMATMQPETGVTVTFSALWLNHSGNNTWLNQTLTSSPHSFLIPTDISLYQDIAITYWANETGRSDDDSVDLNLEAFTATISTRSGSYSPGQTVVADISVLIGGEALQGATVNVQVSKNGTALPAYGATNLVTDIQGAAAYSFVLDANAARGYYIVVATATLLTATAAGETRFNVVWSGTLSADFDKNLYYSGETATVNFRAVWNQQEVQIPTISYEFYISTGVLAIGSTTNMVATVEIPATYSGWIEVRSHGSYNGNMLQDTDTATVAYVSLSLAASVSEYRPGDEVEFTWLIVGNVNAGNLTYEIVDADDAKVAGGAPEFDTSGAFTLTVPDLNPSDEYTATINMGLAGVFRSASVTVDLVDDYELKIWASKSKYADGGYRPGQTVKIQYSVGSYVFSQQNMYRINIGVDFDPVGISVLVTEPTGEIEYKIPKDTPMAYVEVRGALYDVNGFWLSSDTTAFLVSNAESGWDRSIGGMSAIDFTLLVLLIFVILMLIVLPMVKKRMGAPKPPEPAPPPEAGKLPPP